MTLRSLEAEDEHVAYEFLAEAGLEALFLLAAMEDGELRRPRGARSALFTGCFDGDRILGVRMIGPDGFVGLHATDPAVAEHLATDLLARTMFRVASGGPRSIDPFWAACERAGARARHNWRLLGYRTDRESLAPLSEEALRVGTMADLAEICDLERDSYREEVGEDPAVAMGDSFFQRIERRVRMGRSFVLEDGGRIVFKADLGVWATTGAEIHNVYTVPERRGEGIASRATAEMARRALARVPVVSLAVRRENLPAIRAYEKAGFRHEFEFRLVFPEREPAPIPRT